MRSSGAAGAVEALTAALDALAAVELATVPAAETLDRTRALVVARARIDAELARTVRRAELAQAPEEDGLRSMASWLRGHCRVSQAGACGLVRAGRALERLPGLAAAHAAGAVTAEHVAAIAPIAAERALALATEQGVDLSAIDRTLTAYAAGHSPADTARLVHAYLDRIDADGPEPDPTTGRSATVSTHPDGRVTGRFDLDPVGGEKVRAVLESFATAGRTAGDLRTRAQQLGDAFVQWADTTLATGSAPRWRGVRPHLAVKVDLEDLLNPTRGPGAAETGFGATLSAARARWAACDADLTRIVLGPDGQPLDVGRTHRLVPAWLRKAVEQRDGGCVFAGCDAPSWWCEVHHLIAWAHGGETSLENSGLLCERHHTQVHHGFTLERDQHGVWHTYRPDGSEIVIGPRPWLDPGGGPARAADEHREGWALAGASP
jgi:hypothetical protein